MMSEEQGTMENIDHYLYTFSDKDIIDVIVNQEDWTAEEVLIAQQISKQRNLQFKAEEVFELRTRKRLEREKEKQRKSEAKNDKTAGWFLAIAMLSVFNSIMCLLRLNSIFTFVFGLSISQFIDVQKFLIGETTLSGSIFGIIFSCLFFVFYHYTKRGQNWAYITGLLIYSCDMLLSIYVNDWLGVLIHIIVLAFLLQTIVKKYLKTDDTDD